MFSSLTVCLFVWRQDISKSCGRIWMKLGGHMEVGVRQGRIDSILVKIQIQIRDFNYFFKVILRH